ncbi:Serine-threonine protein kinase [Entamoeba marina]
MKSQHTRSTSKKSCPTFLQPKIKEKQSRSLSSSIFKQQSQPHILKSCDDSPFTKLQPDLSYDIPLTSFNTFSLPPFKLSTTHLTFNGVPLIVHDVMNFIIAGLDSNIDWFEDKPLAVIEDLPSLPDVEEDVLFHMVSEVNETLSVVDLKAFGFSYNQALQIKELCKQEDKTCFFQRLDLNENNTNKELADAFNVISEFNITNKLEFSCRNPIKIAFLLLKLYFLSQPEPLLPPSFTLVIETIVASPLSTKTDSQTALLEAIKRLPSTSRPILKEVLSFLKNLVNITMMPSSEIVSLYSCYINAMSHRHWLGKEHLLLISDSSLCATQNTVDLRSGERIIEKIPDVVCPLFFLPVGCTDIPKESVSGTLYFTTHRIVFVSDNPLASHQIDALKVLGETDIHNIHGIHITDPNENCGSRDVKPSVSEKLIPISLTPNINTGSLKLSASTPQGLSSTKSPKSKPTKSFSKSKRKSGSCVTSYTASAPISPLCNSHILRILCSDIRQLTFFINGNLIDYNALLTTIQSTYTPINESILSHDINQEYSIKKLLVSESKRLHCVDSLHSIFNPYSTSKIEIVKEELPDTVILYQTFTGNKLLCFTGDSFDIQLSSQFLSTLSKKVMIIPCHTQTVSKAMALFISIQHAFISTNKEIDGDFMIKYRDDVTHLGECADNMLHSILSCVGNLLHSSKHIIIATEENNSVLCVYSFIIQILIDPYYRSISGFISLFQLCFVAFQYKFTAQPIHFILALIIIERVIMENITQFQYDVLLFITLQHTAKIFLNSCYSSSPNELSLTNILPRLTSLFDRWTLYTQYNISAVISLSEHEIKEQFCTISTMNLTLFPCSTNLGMLTKLTYLDLSNNCFTELPLQVCRLPQLKFLSLNKNNVHHISDQISKLSNLSLLDVANNSLKTLPSFIRVPLISIDISYNPLLSPLKISFNSKLESFTGIGLKEYPFGLSTFENLRTLDLSHTKFDIKPIVTHPPPNLSSLTLRYCKITTLPESFTQLNITYLDISHNHISRFHYSFFSMQTLCELNISYNRLPIISSMFDMMENLTTLESQPQTHQEIYTHLCSLETVIVTGGSYRNEVFSKLIQRLPQYGTVKDITTDSFTLSLPNIDNVKIVNYPVSYLEDLRWTFHRTLFIVCGSNEYDKELKCALLHIQSLHASLQTHVVYSSYSNSTSNSTLEKNSSSQDKQQTSKKSKKEQKKEQKKLKNQLTQNAASKHVCGSGCGECNHFYSKLCKQVSECAAPSPTTCKAVLNELAALHIPHYVLSPQTLEDILLCLRSSTDVLSWLLDAGYLLQTPPSSTLYEQTPPWDNPTYILVDFSIFFKYTKSIKEKDIF